MPKLNFGLFQFDVFWNQVAHAGIIGSRFQFLRLIRIHRLAMTHRRRFKQSSPLEERLAEEAERLRQEAWKLPPGSLRETLLRKARQDETTAHIAEWLTSPGLQPPKP
ncbi:hypothetical protein ACVWXO_006718 [Bradyrhizobium sp. LM2.7]